MIHLQIAILIQRSSQMEGKVPQLSELKQRNEAILAEIYHLSSHKLEQEQFNALKDMFEKSMQIMQIMKVNEDQQSKTEDDKAIEQALSLTIDHQQGLEQTLQCLQKEADQIKGETKILTQFYQLFYEYSCELKKGTLMVKSTKLLNSEINQLKEIKEEYSKLHENKTMYKQMQLAKQNEEQEKLLDEITQETGSELEQLNKKHKQISEQLNRTEILYEKLYDKYNANVIEEDKRKIAEILAQTETKDDKLKKGINKKDNEEISQTPYYEQKSFQMKVLPNKSQTWKYLSTALVAFLAIIVRIFLK